MRPDYKIHFYNEHACIRFKAMAGQCEVLVDSLEPATVEQIAALAYHQALRVDNKFSRYRNDNICHQINTARGESTPIDEETYRLLSFADQCYQSSKGLFDLTSGILRRAWPFDGNNRQPNQQQIDALLCLIGWEKVLFDNKQVTLPAGMEIDLGAIAKEYAVGLVAQACTQLAPRASVLVNFSGDIQVSKARRDGLHWKVNLDLPEHYDEQHSLLEIKQGAMATCSQYHREAVVNGKRFGHILNPSTGWPVDGAPASVTVFAKNCVQAGSLATLGMLQGDNAEAYLQSRQVEYKIVR
ncbi:FAD:protein FMN transferase [Catenovulum sediminis]|uniref:FAD:protein FMN transferase n=1 Tax=Catenovulum sediminis TaxID=1740262 RepID=A0ABV1RGA3_9ALTE|nr:FAD:protein FMN transferase [Catenovulum sediminis]